MKIPFDSGKILAAVPAILIPALAILLLTGNAHAHPAKHAQYMKGETYKNAYTQYEATLEEAKRRFSKEDFAKLEKRVEEDMAASAKEDMSSGTKESEAWELAFTVGQGTLSQEITWEYLRKNPKGVQGFYRLSSQMYDGWLTIEEGDGELYAVKLGIIMKREPFNSGDVDGGGTLKGKEMKAFDKNAREAPFTITFDGETARIKESQAFREEGILGGGVTISGEYTREKR